ncbi:ABC transporter permease subunit, partial [Acinetobacter baumannii]|uniref:ABC transporter permease subunit n=1 Tax=Acinetobacter baumannii TaxID=470 RepID=UPI000B04155F
LVAFVFAIIAGIPLGIIAAVKKDTVWDHGGRVFAIAGVSIPVFWSGLVAVLLFYGYLGWFPSTGRIDLNLH